MENDQSAVIFYGVVALPLGLLGFIGSLVWLARNHHTGGTAISGGAVNLGAILLAVASIIMIIWGVIVLLGYYKAAKENEEEL